MKQRRLLAPAISAVVLCCLLAPAASAQRHLMDVPAALNLYATGAYPQFADALSGDGAVKQDLFKSFEKDANAWVHAPGQDLQRRAIVAASMALEIAHVLHDQQPDRPGEYLVWASLLMQQQYAAAPPSTVERHWHLAAIAAMEEISRPWVLTAGQPLDLGSPGHVGAKLGAGGDLRVALQRFPDDPRFRLAQVEADEARRNEPSDYYEVLTPSIRADLESRAAARVPETPTSADQWQARYDRDVALGCLRDMDRLPEVARRYAALLVDDSLRAEVELHLGYLAYRVNDGAAALTHLARVQPATNETYLRYLAEYFSGRVHQDALRSREAIAAFDRARTLMPNVRSASTQLAAELYVSDAASDRLRVWPLLQAVYLEPTAEDPWRQFFHGDARRWPLYMAQLREALK